MTPRVLNNQKERVDSDLDVEGCERNGFGVGGQNNEFRFGHVKFEVFLRHAEKMTPQVWNSGQGSGLEI